MSNQLKKNPTVNSGSIKKKHIHRWSNFWKVNADSSMERLCLVCGEIKNVGKINKIVMGWAVMNRRDGLECMNAQMPIFWNKEVAQNAADKFGNTKKIRRVKIVL